MLENLIIFPAISFAIFLTIVHLKTLYRRHLKTYNFEIENYLSINGLTLQNIYSPKEKDWKNSPFKKPEIFGFNFFVIKFNGAIVIWNALKYKVVQTNEGKKIWVEIKTTYFKKPILIFKIGEKSKTIKSKNHILNNNIRKVSEICPACGFHISEIDKECPDCGINFE